MHLLKAISLQAETVTFSSALACHSNINVSNSPAGSKLSQVMSLEHHPDKGTGRDTRQFPSPLLGTHQDSTSSSASPKQSQESILHRANLPLLHFSPGCYEEAKGKKKKSKHQKAQNPFCASHSLQLPVFLALNIPI